MITRDLVRLGCDTDFIRLEKSPVSTPNGPGVVCRIGTGLASNWFCFGGSKADECTVDEYLRQTPRETLIEEIFTTLEDFRNCNYPEFNDEYNFYEEILRARFDNNFNFQVFTK